MKLLQLKKEVQQHHARVAICVPRRVLVVAALRDGTVDIHIYGSPFYEDILDPQGMSNNGLLGYLSGFRVIILPIFGVWDGDCIGVNRV